MQTNLADFIKHTSEGQEAEAILRKCVHCGFCTATCPTYQILGDELDSPRGRIYLIKQVLEGAAATEKTQQHLDRCLTCRNCESTCPSGVEYGKLVDIGRKIVDDQVGRSIGQTVVRTALKELLPRRWVFHPAIKLGQMVRPFLPEILRNKVPAPQSVKTFTRASLETSKRKVLMLAGCVQPSLSPNINHATQRVLNAFDVQTWVSNNAGCCGALRFHMNDQEGGRADMRRNIDAWWPYIENGSIEAIVMNASGCGVTVREYDHYLQHDSAYAEKARRISALTRDLSEYLAELVSSTEGAGADHPALKKLAQKNAGQATRKLAFHPPCTLQHGQKIRGVVERLLSQCGYALVLIQESHLCCGSAGTYSVLQPVLAQQLRDRKLANLEQQQPDMIVSANIGCITHLQSGTTTVVKHWIELLDENLNA